VSGKRFDLPRIGFAPIVVCPTSESDASPIAPLAGAIALIFDRLIELLLVGLHCSVDRPVRFFNRLRVSVAGVVCLGGSWG